MTVRKLMKELIKFNPDANVQVGSDNPNCKFTYAVDRIIYNTGKALKKRPEEAIFVAIMPKANGV